MRRLDPLDKKLLYELDYNARQPISTLAKKLRVGRDKITYRIARLQEQNIITGFTVTTNPYKLGITVYKTYLRLENNKSRIQEFIATLKNHPRIYWIAECDGSWDLIFSTFAHNAKEFNEIQNNILSIFADVVREFTTYTLVDVWFYRKNYFLNKGEGFFFFGGTPDSLKLDTTDHAILKLLAKNARMNIVDIASKANTTTTIIKHHIKKMEKEGIIQGYRINVDLTNLNMTFFKAQIRTRTFDKKQEAQLREYCKQHPNITYYINQLGDCKIELELEVDDYKHFNSIINDIRQRFTNFIRSIDTVLISKEHFKWVPYDLAK
jgi:DNA-binding Lrp family transcriptional regulator